MIVLGIPRELNSLSSMDTCHPKHHSSIPWENWCTYLKVLVLVIWSNTIMMEQQLHLVHLEIYPELLTFGVGIEWREWVDIQAPNSTIMEWSIPLGSSAKGVASTFNSINGHSQHLLTATLHPRLRVDNGYRMWNWRGREMQKEAATELYQVVWRPGYACMPAADGSIDTIMNWGKQEVGTSGHTGAQQSIYSLPWPSLELIDHLV